MGEFSFAALADFAAELAAAGTSEDETGFDGEVGLQAGQEDRAATVSMSSWHRRRA